MADEKPPQVEGTRVTGGQVPRHGGYKYPRYAESDRGLNQSVAEAA